MRISDWSSDVCSSDLGERNLVANAANLSALLWHALPDLNWCGFYLYDGAELVVGPFQGLPACIRIPLDKDRKSVGWGKSVSVRVDLGGRRIIKKKKKLKL